jgi:glucose-6-phosphate isomerase
MMQVETGLDISVDPATMDFAYGAAVRGPKPEFRTLDAIRPSLMDPGCIGPSPVYSIAMDVFHEEDKSDLDVRYLLFGVVAYAAGRLGNEPVRSQGHVHALAPHSGWSPPELFEIWEGRAIIYAQQRTGDDPGECVAVTAGPGDKVVVPPGWAHAVINADTKKRMIFGAWCDRQYGFDYTGVRAHGGLAHFPVVRADGQIDWKANDRYVMTEVVERGNREYPELGLDPVEPIYMQYRKNPASVEWVAQPQRFAELWPDFEP